MVRIQSDELLREGSWLLKLFLWSVSTRNACTGMGGMGPVSRLLLTSSKAKEERLEMVSGICPERLLFETEKTASKLRFTIEAGMDPLKLQSKRLRTTRLGRDGSHTAACCRPTLSMTSPVGSRFP